MGTASDHERHRGAGGAAGDRQAMGASMSRRWRAAVAACMLAALPGCHPGEAKPDCWTREHLPVPLTGTGAREPAPGTYHGKLALPDPSNPLVGLRFTGGRCHTRIRHANGRVFAETSLLPGPVALNGRMDESPWYLARVSDGSALVVQTHDNRVVSTTHTVFDEEGVLVYGRCGRPELTFVAECVTN